MSARVAVLGHVPVDDGGVEVTDAGVCYPKSDSFSFIVLRGNSLDKVYALVGSILSRIQVDRVGEELHYFGSDAKEHLQVRPNQYRLEFHNQTSLLAQDGDVLFMVEDQPVVMPLNFFLERFYVGEAK